MAAGRPIKDDRISKEVSQTHSNSESENDDSLDSKEECNMAHANPGTRMSENSDDEVMSKDASGQLPAAIRASGGRTDYYKTPTSYEPDTSCYSETRASFSSAAGNQSSEAAAKQNPGQSKNSLFDSPKHEVPCPADVTSSRYGSLAAEHEMASSDEASTNSVAKHEATSSAVTSVPKHESLSPADLAFSSVPAHGPTQGLGAIAAVWNTESPDQDGRTLAATTPPSLLQDDSIARNTDNTGLESGEVNHSSLSANPTGNVQSTCDLSPADLPQPERPPSLSETSEPRRPQLVSGEEEMHSPRAVTICSCQNTRTSHRSSSLPARLPNSAYQLQLLVQNNHFQSCPSCGNLRVDRSHLPGQATVSTRHSPSGSRHTPPGFAAFSPTTVDSRSEDSSTMGLHGANFEVMEAGGSQLPVITVDLAAHQVDLTDVRDAEVRGGTLAPEDFAVCHVCHWRPATVGISGCYHVVLCLDCVRLVYQCPVAHCGRRIDSFYHAYR